MKRNMLVKLAAILLLMNNICAQQLPLKGICAHRGASFFYPENTLEAIEQAVKLGAQMIEFDVRSTKDKVLVLMHDETVDRTTNGRGAVKNLTLAKIKELDAGLWKGEKFKGEKVPTFEEVLDVVPDTIFMNIHIKNEFETAKAAAELLTKRNQIKNAVMAVDNETAQAVKKINKEIKICCMERGNSWEEYFENTLAVDADFIQLREREYPIINETVDKLKEHNIVINFYYAENLEKLKTLFEAGVDFVLVNNTKELVKEAKEKNDQINFRIMEIFLQV